MSEFFRFPHTPHLAWLGQGQPRDDKVLPSADVVDLLSGPVRVEEKLDGANLGLSVGADGALRAQNRGNYLDPPYRGQFTRLPAWLASRGYLLEETLGGRLILFGEWCAARHSIRYDALSDWFLAFDVFDRGSGRFWSSRRRDGLCADLGIAVAPTLLQGQTTITALIQLVQTSTSGLGAPIMEGVVVRRDVGDWLADRGKLVRGDFTQQIDLHWRNRRIDWNRLTH